MSNLLWLTADEAAALAGVTVADIQAAVRAGNIEYRYFGAYRFYAAPDVRRVFRVK